jgi:hypothetical protein
LPFLFQLLGARFTFLLARQLFNEDCCHGCTHLYFFIAYCPSNFDVRAEGYLTCCTVAAIYYICKAEQGKNIGYIVLAALFTACCDDQGILFARWRAAFVPIIKKTGNRPSIINGGSY